MAENQGCREEGGDPDGSVGSGNASCGGSEESGEVMGFCKIGEKKNIEGRWYTKKHALRKGFCDGCTIANNPGRCRLYAKERDTHKAIEDSGSECCGTIWVACPAPKPAKKLTPAKWEPLDLREMWGIGAKTTRARILEILLKTEETLNAYGRENARLKNQLAKLKGQK